MKIPLDRSSRNLYLQIADFIDRQITAGNLPPGSLLPPIREMAEELGVSKATVTMAYAELQAAGRVAGRVGQGTVVTQGVPAAPPPTPRPPALPNVAPGAAVLNDLIRLSHQPGTINLSTLGPGDEVMPVSLFGRCLAAAVREDGASAFVYAEPSGDPGLRRSIARLLTDRGIIARPEEILVTAGAQQGIDLALRALTLPGEWVVAESPCYMGALEAMQAHGVRIAPAPMDDGGLVIDELEPLLGRLRPRLLYTTPTFQNPTGTTLSLERRRKLVELAARYDVLILEDGVCAEIELDGPAPPALRALSHQVVCCGSFSKGLLPGLRLGYVTAPAPILTRLTQLKQSADLSSPLVLQRALARFLDGGRLRPHLDRTIGYYQARRKAALEALQRHFPPGARWNRPNGAMHLWITLPPEIDVTALYLAALGQGVGFTPGALFYPSGGGTHQIRICYGAEPPDRVQEGIARLGRLIAAQVKAHAAESPPRTHAAERQPLPRR